MFKPTVFIVAILVLASLTLAEHSIASTSSKLANSTFEDRCRTVEFAEDGIVVTYDFTKNTPGLKTTSNNCNPIFELPGFVTTFEGSRARLPKRTDSFIMPMDCKPQMKIIENLYHDVDVTCEMEDSLILYGEAFQKEVCLLRPLQKYRNYPVAQVEIVPIQLTETRGKLRVCDRLTYKLYYDTPTSKLNKSIVLEPETLVDLNSLYSTNFISPIFPPDPEPIILPVHNPGYLIISAPKFKEHLEPFIKWKKMLGYTVYEAYENSWTPEKIKSHILNLYQEHSDLQYLLIVGDHSVVPAENKHYVYYSETSGNRTKHIRDLITDFHYACLDGDDDLFADLYRGRWPIRTISELEYIIEKSIRYEMEPTLDSQFYSSASHFGYFQDIFDYSFLSNNLDLARPDGKEDVTIQRTR